MLQQSTRQWRKIFFPQEYHLSVVQQRQVQVQVQVQRQRQGQGQGLAHTSGAAASRTQADRGLSAEAIERALRAQARAQARAGGSVERRSEHLTQHEHNAVNVTVATTRTDHNKSQQLLRKLQRQP